MPANEYSPSGARHPLLADRSTIERRYVCESIDRVAHPSGPFCEGSVSVDCTARLRLPSFLPYCSSTVPRHLHMI
ncbi:hypothetical protein M6B38_322645 [Iris pallida]|uniref:Uncharacterized protein n=1 Tax=Iris pallida TaxID=29817 RepID=A0AAX6HB22_IRIPA|nr:hypothetical protein M6B38_322645 [Iris pallida]